MFVQVGWKNDSVQENFPISGWMGGTLLMKSDKKEVLNSKFRVVLMAHSRVGRLARQLRPRVWSRSRSTSVEQTLICLQGILRQPDSLGI